MGSKTRPSYSSFGHKYGSSGPVDTVARDKVDKEPEVDVAITLPLEDLIGNPENVREDLSDLENLRSIARTQYTPIAVMTRAAFLKVCKDIDPASIDKPYVVVNGNRRLAAARKFGRPELKAYVQDDWSESRAEFLANIMGENTDRTGINPIEEAKQLHEMLEELGDQNAVAEAVNKGPAWVSQRLALLRLPNELQNALRSGELAFSVVRTWSKLSGSEQLELYAAHREGIRRRQRQDRQRVEEKERGREQGSGTTEPPEDAESDSDRMQVPMKTVTRALRGITDKDAAKAAEALVAFLGSAKANRLRIDLGKQRT